MVKISIGGQKKFLVPEWASTSFYKIHFRTTAGKIGPGAFSSWTDFESFAKDSTGLDKWKMPGM